MKRSTAARARLSLTAGMLGILLVGSLATGCSRAGSLTVALSGMAFAPDAAGFEQLLDRLDSMNPQQQRTQLSAFADSQAPAAIKQKAAYALARLLQQSSSPDDVKQAVARFRQAQLLLPLAQRCRLHISECARQLNDEQLVRDTLSEIIASSNDKDKRAAAIYALGQSYMRTGDRLKARQTLSRIFELAPQSQFALGSTYYLAQLDLADAADLAASAQQKTASGVQPMSAHPQAVGTAGSTTIAALPPAAAAAAATGRAIAAFKHYLVESPSGRFAMDIASQLQHMPEFQPTAADHNLLARVFYVNGDYKDALSQWRKAGNTAEWFKQANCLLRIGQTTDGRKMLATGMQAHPNDEAVPAAAAIACRFVNRDGAIAIWKGVLQRRPKFADVAGYNIGTRTQTQSLAAALPYYQHIVQAHPNSAYAPESAWWLSWSQIKNGNAKSALSMLQMAANRYSQAKANSRFLFWIGKMYERLGDKEAAKHAYIRTISRAPWHYYAHRAQARLAALNGGRDPGWSTKPKRQVAWAEDTSAQWEFPEPPQMLAHQKGATIEVLTELRQWDECLELLPEKTSLLKAFYLAKLNMPMEAINCAGKALHGQPSGSEAWQLAYPLLYARFIAAEAPTKQIDPYLVQALVREESRYNTQAVSGSHALGLMQLMPGTALGVAKRLGIPIHSNADIHDPQTNLRLGIDYLSYVLRRFSGNALYAVASYNGGPNAVQKWSANRPPDTDAFVEEIPFKETREYVRKVFGSYWNYQNVYKQPQKPN